MICDQKVTGQELHRVCPTPGRRRTHRAWSTGAMGTYVHGYGTPEQERLVQQAEHWRHSLIRDGTDFEPGTRLLEVGTGVGAVLAVLGQEFPGIELTGVDIEPKQ